MQRITGNWFLPELITSYHYTETIPESQDISSENLWSPWEKTRRRSDIIIVTLCRLNKFSNYVYGFSNTTDQLASEEEYCYY